MSLGTVQATSETPTMTNALEAVIQKSLLEMNTCLPGQIESFNPATGMDSIQPSIKIKYVKDDEVVNLPIINDVPIIFPRAGESAITFPLKKGDGVLIIFSQRSIERWKSTGGIVEAGDPRHHALSDAFAIPGAYDQTSSISGFDADNLVIRNGNASKVTVKPEEIEIAVGSAKLVVTKDGKFSIGNGVINLLDVLDATLTALQVMTVPTGTGPSGIPVNATDFAKAQLDLGTIKS